ncbi:glycerol-3-phosphate acyltransferase 2, mitochondrial [Chelydra serpentina]|uniref:Glycerol-3-phosphate acyltransferase 2, mitochondrial n=1 Tax=Chelydra serpentina TaxID=8475 RepID=A0A8T1SZW4_CHESE|nr:glycerol-3-phosphate acyltransferase 2, mitochondrial [Chelydra serpentina]
MQLLLSAELCRPRTWREAAGAGPGSLATDAAGPKSLRPACALRSGRAMALSQQDSTARILLAEEKLPQRNMKTWPLGFGVKLEIVTPFLGKYRPFVGRCCQTCTPKSWQSSFHKHLPSLGFHNVLQVTEENTRYRGWLVRRLCYFLAVLDWKVHSETPRDLQERIFHNKRVQDVTSPKVPQARGAGSVLSKSPAQWRSEALSILGHIQSPLSLFILRLCSWALLRLLNRMFLNVLLHKGQLEMVRRAAQTPDVPLVFLSTRKSQLDGLLLPFLLFSQGLGVPRVTWEYQAYTPSLRALLSQLGGVFLPPGVEHAPDSERGALSRAVLTSYVEELLKSRQHLVIFLEEPVSGVPRLSAPGGEWLALVLGAVCARAVPDVMLVPVGIAYDVTPNASRGGLSGSAPPFGLWSCLLAVRRALGREFGCVRVDFAQPFSLQEYAANSLFRQSCSRKSLEELLLPVILGKSPDLLDWEKSEEWYPGLGAAAELKVDERRLVGRLALHSLSAGVSCSAVMAVAIMSALLLHKHREGVFLSRLMSDFSWLVEETLLRNRDVGFSGAAARPGAPHPLPAAGLRLPAPPFAWGHPGGPQGDGGGGEGAEPAQRHPGARLHVRGRGGLRHQRPAGGDAALPGPRRAARGRGAEPEGATLQDPGPAPTAAQRLPPAPALPVDLLLRPGCAGQADPVWAAGRGGGPQRAAGLRHCPEALLAEAAVEGDGGLQ